MIQRRMERCPVYGLNCRLTGLSFRSSRLIGFSSVLRVAAGGVRGGYFGGAAPSSAPARASRRTASARRAGTACSRARGCTPAPARARAPVPSRATPAPPASGPSWRPPPQPRAAHGVQQAPPPRARRAAGRAGAAAPYERLAHRRPPCGRVAVSGSCSSPRKPCQEGPAVPVSYPTLEAFVRAHVARSFRDDNGCLLSPMSRNHPRGYPRGGFRGRVIYIGHAVLEVAYGPANGRHMLHSCHNPQCIALEHLRWGTRAENAHDMVHAGNHSRQVLSADDVREVRRLARAGATPTDIAARYPVGRASISHILNGRNWKHLPG